MKMVSPVSPPGVIGTNCQKSYRSDAMRVHAIAHGRRVLKEEQELIMNLDVLTQDQKTFKLIVCYLFSYYLFVNLNSYKHFLFISPTKSPKKFIQIAGISKHFQQLYINEPESYNLTLYA
jgi:hypothetical protein